ASALVFPVNRYKPLQMPITVTTLSNCNGLCIKTPNRYTVSQSAIVYNYFAISILEKNDSHVHKA
ncbi:MAG: hypothetical protein WC389_16790, partial [Lutibacter sp.]